MTSIEKYPVLLTIRGEQYFDDVDPDETKLMTDGTMEVTEEGYLLTYQETELTGMEGTTTTFLVTENQVVLTRTAAGGTDDVAEYLFFIAIPVDTPVKKTEITVEK